MKRTVIVLILIVFSLTTIAQKTWTLQECIEYALQHNIDIQKLQLQKESVTVQQTKAKHAILPSVNGFANYYNTNALVLSDEAKSLNVNRTTSSGAIGLDIGLDLFKGLSNYMTIKKYNELLLASGYDVDAKKNDIMLEVGTSFLYMFYNKEKLKTLESQLERTQTVFDKNKKLYDAGELTEADVLKIEAQLATEQLELKRLEIEISKFALDLALAMNVDVDSIQQIQLGLEIPENIEKNTLASKDSVYTQALQLRPEILASDAIIKSKEYDIALAKSGAMPSLSVGYNVITDYNKPAYNNLYNSEHYFDNIYGQLYVNLSVPIFNKFDVKHSVAQRQIEKSMAELDLVDKKNELYNIISITHNNVETAAKQLDMQQKALELMQKTFDFAQRQSQLGEISMIDFIIEKNKLNESEIGLLLSKYEYLLHRLILNFYATNEIKL